MYISTLRYFNLQYFIQENHKTKFKNYDIENHDLKYDTLRYFTNIF